MNRGHRNFKSAHKRVVLARLQAHEELQPRDTRGFGRSRPPRSHERLIAAKIAPTLVAVAFSERSHIARPLANDRMHSPVGEVSSNPTGVMIQRGSGEQLRVGMGEYGNHGKAREPSSARTWARTRQRRPLSIAVGVMSMHCWWKGRVFTRQAHPLRRFRASRRPPHPYTLSCGVFVARISLMRSV